MYLPHQQHAFRPQTVRVKTLYSTLVGAKNKMMVARIALRKICWYLLTPRYEIGFSMIMSVLNASAKNKGAIPPNQPVYHLPSCITHLTFGSDFDQPLSAGCIPSSVLHLTFGWNYSQVIAPKVLPPSITYLEFGGTFNQYIATNVIPPSVTHLKFGHAFNQPIYAGMVPCSVTQLRVN